MASAFMAAWIGVPSPPQHRLDWSRVIYTIEEITECNAHRLELDGPSMRIIKTEKNGIANIDQTEGK